MTSLPDRLAALADDDPAAVGADPAPGAIAGAALARARVRSRARRAASTTAAALAVALVVLGVQARDGLRPFGAPDTRTAAGPTAGGPTADGPATDGRDGDPWAGTPRVTVLLVGSDAAPGRTGTRADSLVLASVDTRTGAALLVGVPRNLTRVPFPAGSAQARAFPKGFTCPTGPGVDPCLLNALWTWAEDNAVRYYPGDPQPGLTATRAAVEQVTGLRVDHHVVLDMRAFAAVVDAVGGVEVTVRQRLPIGDPQRPRSHVEPGKRRLGGEEALWFARSRSTTDDYDRMRRQRCLIAAFARQLDPAVLARVLPGLARSLSAGMRTSIPLQELSRWVLLGQRVRDAGAVRELALVPPLVDPQHPDPAAMRRAVAQAVHGRDGAAGSPGPSAPAPAPTGPAC